MGLKSVYRIECKGHKPRTYVWLHEAMGIYDELIAIDPKRKVSLFSDTVRVGQTEPLHSELFRTNCAPKRAAYVTGRGR